MEFVTIRRDVFAEQTIDIKSLLVADKRDHAKRRWLARVIRLAFGLLHRGGEQCSDAQGFLAIDLAVPAGASHPIRNGVRAEMDTAGVAQRLDAVIVR